MTKALADALRDPLQYALNIANRSSDDGPRMIHCGTSFIMHLRQCTQEEAEAWAMASPLATYMGGGWWQIVKSVEPGDHSRLETA